MDALRLLHSARVRSETRPGDDRAEDDELRATIALCKERIRERRDWADEVVRKFRDRCERASDTDRRRQVTAERRLAEIKRERKDHGR